MIRTILGSRAIAGGLSVAIVSLWLSTAGAASPAALDSTLAESESVPVVVWNREITRFRTPFQGLSPAGRAAQAERRILAIPARLPEYVVVAEPTMMGADSGYVIFVNSAPAFGLLERDADLESGETLRAATDRAAANLQAWLASRNEQLRWPTFLRGLAWSVVATVLAILLLTLLFRLHRRVVARLERSAEDSSRPLRVGKVDVRPYVHAVEAGLVRTITWTVAAATAYSWVTIVLGRFPYTRPWGQQLGGFILDVFRDLGLGFIRSIPNLFIVTVIFLIARMFARLTTAFFRTAEATWMQTEIAHATRRLVVALLWVFALIVAYPYLPGSGTAAFQGISVFVGLMVSLGSSGMVSQLLGGLVVVYTRAFSLGEYVRIGDHEGTVTEIGALAAKVTTLRKEEITIPYSVVVGSATTNYSRRAGAEGAVVATTIGVGYDVPWRQVVAMMMNAAAKTAAVLREPAPRVLMSSLSNFAVEYRMLVRIARPADRYAVLSALHTNILDVFNEHGVQIMTPAFESQPEGRIVVPKTEWYAAPAQPEAPQRSS